MSRRAGVIAVVAVLALSDAGCRRTRQARPGSDAAAERAASVAKLAASVAGDVPGPVPGTRITEAYVRMVARQAYFWAWPLVNIYNRRLAFAQAPEPGLKGGILPVAPLNRLAMLTDYVEPEQRDVACPNQDVVYGGGVLALDLSPVVIQVPDFGDRFWVYQVVDLRTDSFADLGAMHGTAPGFYLLTGPDWKGDPPNGIAKVFRATTSTGFVVPRVFQDDTPEDKSAVQSVLAGIDMYPLAEFDGTAKSRDWTKLPTFGTPAAGGTAETRWVFADQFLAQLPLVLKDAPPLPGEGVRYAEMLAMIEAAQKAPFLRTAVMDEAAKTERDLVDPLLQFRNFGIPLPHNWTTQVNGAMFGSDYFTRTAVAKSNILVNKPIETRYFYLDVDASGSRLNGGNNYTITIAKAQLPPVKGFWSLTLYDQSHFFAPNPINRYSIGTKSKDLKPAADGSLTISVQAAQPTEPTQRANWLPAPKNEDFSLYIRAYWPEAAISDGSWTPPAVVKQ